MEKINKNNKIIVFCGPSGSGKNTILKKVMEEIPELMFYVSATSRPIREGEKNGVDYNFLSKEEFENKIQNNEFVEWEEVYGSQFYGTLKSEIERIQDSGKIPVSDIDVKGAMNIKSFYLENALVVFIKAPLEIIRERLIARGTESVDKVEMRIARFEEEFSYENKCDVVIENIDLEEAVQKAVLKIQEFLAK